MTAPSRRRASTVPPGVLPAGSRLAERARLERRARSRRRVRRASVAALALVPVLLLSWVLLASPLLSARTVQVVGTSRLSAADVRTAAGVRPGTPLAGLDTAGVRARVAALTDVARVRVVRAWPRTVRLVVAERVPVAAVARPDGTWLSADAAGAVFAPAAQRPGGLPEVRVGDGGALPAGSLQVLAELPAALRDQVSSADTRPGAPAGAASVRLALRDGRTVVWGAPGDAARKAAVVTALLPRPGRTLDVTAPGVAVVR